MHCMMQVENDFFFMDWRRSKAKGTAAPPPPDAAAVLVCRGQPPAGHAAPFSGC
jgi:hypothetical protein